jgi:hypothetical protein
MINIKVSEAELSYIKNLAKKHNITISRLLRNMVYTYFYTLDKGEIVSDLTDVNGEKVQENKLLHVDQCLK